MNIYKDVVGDNDVQAGDFVLKYGPYVRLSKLYGRRWFHSAKFNDQVLGLATERGKAGIPVKALVAGWASIEFLVDQTQL